MKRAEGSERADEDKTRHLLENSGQVAGLKDRASSEVRSAKYLNEATKQGGLQKGLQVQSDAQAGGKIGAFGRTNHERE